MNLNNFGNGCSDVDVKKHNGKWSGFHPLDTEMKIDIAGQPTKEDCCNWMDNKHQHIKFSMNGKMDITFEEWAKIKQLKKLKKFYVFNIKTK